MNTYPLQTQVTMEEDRTDVVVRVGDYEARAGRSEPAQHLWDRLRAALAKVGAVDRVEKAEDAAGESEAFEGLIDPG